MYWPNEKTKFTRLVANIRKTFKKALCFADNLLSLQSV